ncbi:hypothetical protein GDO86_020406 [Hymenochirus boettgeri]|uniref:Nectin-4 n=1 Tax=Hymenochirus boettgeri TaxID=247094 RepID=A0A8T2IGB2_9PIPI|nr:hypothetical protein GDO86_020406 [Hymenochirus boettgeri]
MNVILFLGCPSGTVITDKSISAVLGMDVTLPCYYHIEADEKVAQVSWVKKETDGQNTDIAILNIEYGTIVFGAYSGRVKEKSPLDSEDGGIVLKNAVQADEGTYQCRVNTFPAGNFDAELQLKVLVPPLPTLSPGPTLTEGDGKTLAASCTAEGNPAPSLAWDTEVDGINQTQRYQHPRSASVTSDFYVVPSRRMNGKALSCVVSHPGFQQEKRITHVLDVRYLAGVSIQGYEESWFVGKEAATLKCICEGNPPAVYKWSRTNSSLPEGIKTGGDTLQFLRPLEAEDAGVYICQSTNDIASRQGMVTISISGMNLTC